MAGADLEMFKVFLSFSLVSGFTVTAPPAGRGEAESHLTSGRFESLTVSPPGNFSSSRAASEFGLKARLAGEGAMGLKVLTGWTGQTEATGMLELTLLYEWDRSMTGRLVTALPVPGSAQKI